MFTGIVEEIGRVYGIQKGVKSSVLTITGKQIFDDLKIGDSVSTNGVCLTVTDLEKNTFKADIMNETLMRSTLGTLSIGSRVNLERAMPLNGRFGGHVVTGHIDGTGKIVSITKDDNAIWYTIQAVDTIMNYIIEKGSIAIDGVSLTVARVERDRFSVSVIPHTANKTVLSEKKIGASVNLENDMIGKYIEKFMKKTTKIDIDFINKHGF